MKKLPNPTVDTPTLTQLRLYIIKIHSDSQPQWGTMNSSEMCKHCNNFISLYQGKLTAPIHIRILAR